MRKLFGFIIGGIIVLLIIIFLAIQLGISFLIKNNYQRILNNIHKSPIIALKVVKFERGWFTSKATVQATIKSKWLQPQQRDTGATPNNPLQFTIQQRIKNGPWIFGAHKFLWAMALIQSASDNANFKFRSQTVLHFNNAVDNTFKAKSITLANNQRQLVGNDITSHSIFSPKTQRLQLKISIGSASVVEKQSDVVALHDYQQKFAVKNLTLDSQQKYVKPLWYGNRSITSDKIIYYNSKNQPIVITHVTLSSKTSRHNSTTTNTTTAHANSVTGADLNLQPIDLQFSIADIDTHALINLTNAALKLRHATSRLSRQQLQALHVPFIALVNKGFTVTLHHLNVGTPEGAINAAAQLTVPKQTSASNMLLLLENASGELNMQLPMAWLQRRLASIKTDSNQQIQQWLHNKKLIQDGQNVKIAITFKNGKLRINGLPPSYQAPVQKPMQQPSIGTTTPQ